MTTNVQDMLNNGVTPDLDTLRALLLNGDPRDKIITGDEVAFHDNVADKRIVLPQGFGFKKAITVLQRKQEEQEAVTNFDKVYDYLYHDGIVATNEVLKARYGLTLAKGIPTFFGDTPAQMEEIYTGYGVSAQYMSGLVEIPTLEGSRIYMGRVRNRNGVIVFQLMFEGPRKHKAEVEAFFAAVGDYLRMNSIYKGKTLAGTSELEFLNLKINRDEVVFSEVALDQLDNLLWGPIRNAMDYRSQGIPLKRAVLLHGPFGTGKTSIGSITSIEARENGWTFLTARPGDKIEDVMRVATLYQPSVVMVEDIEVAANGADASGISKLLDVFDGATSKGQEIILVLNTNHIEQVPKGMLRPGRIDATIEIGHLDASAVEKLIRAVVKPEKLDKGGDGIDYAVVFEQMEGYLPAFVKSAIDRAKTWALNRTGPGYVLTTKDLAGAALSLRDQFNHMNDAEERGSKPTLNEAFEDLVDSRLVQALNNTYWDRDTDTGYDAELVHDAEQSR